MAKKDVAVIVGSFRKGSINEILARALARLGEDRMAFTFCRIDDLPLFCQDIEDPPLPAVERLKAEVSAAQGVLVVTPEYNRSIPAALKNALDWANRPARRNDWAGKPVAITGATRGNIGTAVAQQGLRQTLVASGAVVMGMPTVYFTYRDGLIAEDFSITDDGTAKFLKGFMEKFDDWIETNG